jgi:hypothetical protein
MSSQWNAIVFIDKVEQLKFTGHGDTVKEAVNSIEYCDGKGNSLNVTQLADFCEATNSLMEIVATCGPRKLVFSMKEIIEICAN